MPVRGVTSPGAMFTHVLDRHYPIIIAHTGSCAGPQSSPDINLDITRVFAGCCEPLLEDGPSRRYLLNLCIGAWPLTPWRLFGAFARFFPKSIGLISELRDSARSVPSRCNFNDARFRGCRHSFMFRLPYSLGPQIAPTAEARCLQGSRAVYITQWTCGYPS